MKEIPLAVSIPVLIEQVPILLKAVRTYKESIDWSGLTSHDEIETEKEALDSLMDWIEAAQHLADLVQRAKALENG